MEFLRPATWADALAAKAEHPDALPIAGGTDVMVELNFDLKRPKTLLDLTRIGELTDWATTDDSLRIGAGVPYSRLIAELGGQLPGLAMAARTVGSPQIRNRGTVGGNLGAASPAGDTHPPLLANDAVVEAHSVRGSRRIPIADFYAGVKRNVLEPDELIAAFWMRPATGPQQFSKIGTRNAMVIAVTAFALSLHPDRGRVGTGFGSAAPTPRSASTAEEFLENELRTSDRWESRAELDPATITRFGELVAAAASPIDDVRGTAQYRRHALSVMARRTLIWAWHDYRRTDHGNFNSN
ncbi:xanthine dehydrogenase family protein subunit M [Nocardia uniformis]|uniref:Xanthine dehydrogenase family protein subunit M n=1 Tax=Nocardia uniformis TaxID=53432 RepID=A0A849C100_9NOCA|nr:xanthine dehydrogenase family protein subunit M [Nocardia uniformis]NNH71318.1 xanthine dehydrogenase family protein subunit M [Nocardia uniformis]